MDRCALFVDAGYLLADGAMAVHGTRNRDSVAWDYAGLARLLNEVARDRTGLPPLRCYWYEATSEGRRTQEQDSIADIPGIKFRAARIRPGRREGVESYVQRDLTTLARAGALCDAVLVSGDEDMAQVVADVQDLGVRATVIHISVEGNWTISRALRRECDDLIEIGAGHLRPYVNLLSGGVPEEENAAETTNPMANGVAHSGPEVERHQVAAQSGASHVEPSSPNALESVLANSGAQQSAGASAMDQLRAMQQSIEQQRGGDHLAPQANGGMENAGNSSGGVDANGFPAGGGPSQHATNTGGNPTMAGNAPSGHEGGFPPGTGPNPSMHGMTQGNHGPPQGPAPGSQGQPPGPPPPQQGPPPPQGPPQQGPPQGPPPQQGQPPMPQQGQPQHHQPPSGQQVPLSPHQGPPSGQQMPPQQGPPGRSPTGANPSMRGGQYDQETPPGQSPPPPDPRYGPNTGGHPGYGGNTGPNPTIGASTEAETGFGNPPANQPDAGAGTGPHPSDQQVQHGPYTNPTPRVSHAQPGGSSAWTLDDAVHVAQREGNDFAESIARDAPALWLEAVLVRKPRMPSDLEARLLQGSVLPIDYLLRDEVREALRQGFWSALERARD